MNKVLIIDDEENIRTTMADRLGIEGYQAVTAADANSGIMLAEQENPSLILCDIMMPDTDGYQVLKTLRAKPETRSIPFIFMTAKTEHHDIRQGMNCGAADYLCKPITKEELLASIRCRLECHEQQKMQEKQRLDKARSEITASISHELLTPLSGILGISEVFKRFENVPDLEEINRLGNYIQSGANRLHTCIKRFVLYTDLMLQAAAMQPGPKQRLMYISDTRSCVSEEALKVAKEWDRERHLQCALEIGRADLPEPLLRHVVQELVDNAFKFSPRGTLVTVSTKTTSAGYELVVADQGCGMTRLQMDSFEVFRQFDRPKNAQRGVGLGLAIVRLVADLYGGRIELAGGPRSGTWVTATFPGCMP
jgi:signal transduction histidine kinase